MFHILHILYEGVKRMKKSAKKMIYIPLLLVILSGCTYMEDINGVKEKSVSSNKIQKNHYDSDTTTGVDFQNSDNIKIIKDTRTGCEYVIINPTIPHAVMSPYYNEKGEINGCGK
jgi:nitrate reductase cytochrome c-type subunit